MGIFVSPVSQFLDVGFDFVACIRWRINLVEQSRHLDVEPGTTLTNRAAVAHPESRGHTKLPVRSQVSTPGVVVLQQYLAGGFLGQPPSGNEEIGC